MGRFFTCIIGTEILLGRRVDKHFEFVKDELKKRGFELSGSFVVKDDKKLLEDVFNLFKADKNATLFCFGGIGSTPDDLTREISAKVFTSEELVLHVKAQSIIENEFKQGAYPHRIKMAYLPKNAKLLTNVVNKIPGYFLENRLFFMPGFPSMAHPMVLEALDLHVKQKAKRYFVFRALVKTREGNLVSFMESLPKEIELSSLPQMSEDGYRVEIMLRSFEKTLTDKWSATLEELLQKKDIQYTILEKDNNGYK